MGFFSNWLQKEIDADIENQLREHNNIYSAYEYFAKQAGQGNVEEFTRMLTHTSNLVNGLQRQNINSLQVAHCSASMVNDDFKNVRVYWCKQAKMVKVVVC
jgi:hypothetical protein